jgi:hypothetical protein
MQLITYMINVRQIVNPQQAWVNIAHLLKIYEVT